MYCKKCLKDYDINSRNEYAYSILPCNHILCVKCFNQIKIDQCPVCKENIKEKIPHLEPLRNIRENFVESFNEHVRSIEEHREKFKSNSKRKERIKNEIMKDLKNKIIEQTNEIINMMIGYQDELLKELENLDNDINKELSQLDKEDEEVLFQLDELKYFMTTDSDRGMSYHEIENEIVKLNKEAVLNLEDLFYLTTKYRFEPFKNAFTCTNENKVGSIIPDIQFQNDKLLSICGNEVIKIWDMHSGECIQSFKGHKSAILCVKIINKKRFLTGSKDFDVKLWDVETGACLRTYKGHNFGICDIELSFDDKQFLTSSYDKTIKLWKIDELECLYTLDAYSPVFCMALLDSDILYGGTNGGCIRIWNLSSLKLIKSWKAHNSDIFCIVVLSDTEIITSSKDGKINIWNTRTMECLKTLNGHKNAINCIKLLSDDELISSSHDGTIKIWDIRKGDCLHEIETLSITRSFTISYEDNLLIYPNREHIKIYDLDQLCHLKTIYGHTFTVNRLEVIQE